MNTLRSIVAATDFSPTAREAVRFASMLAEKFSARLFVVHIVRDLRDYTGVYIVDMPLGDLQREIEAEAHGAMKKLCAAELEGKYAYESAVLLGEPTTSILKYAEEKKADLIVLGAHGNDRPLHKLFGSVAGRVARHATVPVVTVREASDTP